MASVLCYQGHMLMENRSGLVVGAVVSHADSTGERKAALREGVSRFPGFSASRRRPRERLFAGESLLISHGLSVTRKRY